MRGILNILYQANGLVKENKGDNNGNRKSSDLTSEEGKDDSEVKEDHIHPDNEIRVEMREMQPTKIN